MSAVLLPDRTARKFWDRVSDSADRIDDIVDGIARLTVAGEQTRVELAQAADLLKQAEAILNRVSQREAPLFDERLLAMGIDVDGPVTEA